MQDSSIADIAQWLFEDQGQVGAEVLERRVACRLGGVDGDRALPGTEVATYQRPQRFMAESGLQAALARLHDTPAPFAIGDPTEIARSQAKRTVYVGYLQDGKTRSFWVLMLVTPYRGHALPCAFVTYSSQTIADEIISRNQYHFQVFAALEDLLAERPLVLDREFSYLSLLQALVAERVQFVIRLNLSGSPPPHFHYCRCCAGGSVRLAGSRGGLGPGQLQRGGAGERHRHVGVGA